MDTGIDTLQVATALTALVGNLAFVAIAAWLRVRRPGFGPTLALFASVSAIVVGVFQLALPWLARGLALTDANAEGAAWVLGTLGALCDLAYAGALAALLGRHLPKADRPPTAP